MAASKSERKLPFDIKEYRQRLAKVRKNMEKAGADVMLVTAPENIYYLLGYHTVGYFSFQVLIVALDRDPIMLARGLNTTQVESDSWIKDIEGYGDTDDPNDALVRVLGKYGLLKKRIGNQNNAFFFTVAQYKKLVARLGKEPVDCSGVIEQVRLIKSPAELAYMRKAGKCAGAAIDACLDSIRPGNTENDVAAALHDGLIRSGSEYLGHPPLVVTGPAAGVGMETWKRRKIKKNDVFFIENGGTYNRYNVGLSRTVIVGKPGQKWIDMYDACRDGFMKAGKAMKPGVTSHEVDKACRDHIKGAGYPFDKRVGYSIGIGFPPDWGEGRTASINQGDRMVLKAGMVFHMVPNLRIYGEGAVMFSETWAVTEKGSECLTKYNRDLMYR
jgi:Xaa-Pro dipeptidase